MCDLVQLRRAGPVGRSVVGVIAGPFLARQWPATAPPPRHDTIFLLLRDLCWGGRRFHSEAGDDHPWSARKGSPETDDWSFAPAVYARAWTRCFGPARAAQPETCARAAAAAARAMGGDSGW